MKMKIILIVFAILILNALSNYFRWGYDSTDNKRPGRTFGKRSGLSLYTDNLTGIQYVKHGFLGSITPRLDKDGKPITKETYAADK
jgi:hypothetical protein